MAIDSMARGDFPRRDSNVTIQGWCQKCLQPEKETASDLCYQPGWGDLAVTAVLVMSGHTAEPARTLGQRINVRLSPIVRVRRASPN